MILKVLTTKREIRDCIKGFEDGFVPKVVSIGEFFEKAVVVKDRKFIDEDLRKIYLYKAVRDIDISSLGIKKNFLDFFKNSELIFGFLREVYLEDVDLESIDLADTYLEYTEHIALLKEIYHSYKNLLEKDGFVDKITIGEFEINRGFFENVEKIEFELLGYLSRFERKVLEKIPVDIEMSFEVTKFNKNLIAKMFGEYKEGKYIIDFATKNVIKYEPLKESFEVDVSSFSKRIDEVNFVFASVEEMVRKGIDAEKIVVVLPDEGFSEYLEIFNEQNKNLNFAMGESFEKSDIYRLLKAIYDFKVENDEIAKLKCEKYLEEYEQSDILEFIENHISNREKKVIEEEIFKLKRLQRYIDSSKEEVLKFILERFKNLSFDDTRGGRVTVMGVLESRGIEADGVIIVDFNEEFVPNINDKDFFLNTAIRKKVNLPTREDKEALQKNYYYSLLKRAKYAKIAYVKNETSNISRFGYELGIGEGESRSEYYSNVLYEFSKAKKVEYTHTFEIPKVLYPTTLDLLLECPKRYYLSRVLDISNEEKSEYFGSRFHKVMEHIYKKPFKDYKEYYDAIMKGLLNGVDKKEEFFIKSRWEDKIFEFAKKDFGFLQGVIETERVKQAKKGKFLLKAKYDRIIGNLVFDYKTSSTGSISPTQAEFYKYIMKDAKIYFWDIYNVRLIEYEPDLKELDNKLSQIQNISSKNEGKHCRFCEYQFSCL